MLLTVRQAAERLGYTAAYVRTLIASGRLTALRLGGRGHYRIDEDAIAALCGVRRERRGDAARRREFRESMAAIQRKQS